MVVLDINNTLGTCETLLEPAIVFTWSVDVAAAGGGMDWRTLL